MTQEGTRSTFGFKWRNFPVVTADDQTRPALAYGEERLQRNGWEPPTFEEWVGGKTVLDAGCGVGWYTEYLRSRNPTGTTIGIDIAEEAVRKGRDLGHGDLLVGDIGAPPFPDEYFDYIACEEVLHHTPDPPEYLQGLVRSLRRGGTITLYVYKEKPLLREQADELLRERTTRMSIEECLEFSEQMTALGRALSDLDEEITVPEIPLLDVEEGSYDVHEFVYRHFLKCYFDWRSGDWDTSVATNFDWYHPEYAFRYDEPTLRSILDDACLEVVHFEELMSGYAVRATRR